MPQTTDKTPKASSINKLLNIEGLRWHFNFFLNPSDLAALARTFRGNHHAYQPDLNLPASKKLLQHVVLGQQKAAEEMIAANPSLLLIESEAEDYSGRIIVGTAFQASLGAGDSLMWEMMKPYFLEIRELQEQAQKEQVDISELARLEMLKQYNKQFPGDIEQETAIDLMPFYEALVIAITNDADNGEVAITDFRTQLESSGKKVNKGHHFNMQHLIAVMTAYVDNFERLDSWANRDTFWIEVIGFVQRQIPAHFAQAHCSGLKSVADNPSTLKRCLKFYKGGRRFFPVLQNRGLGFSFAVYSGNGRGRLHHLRRAPSFVDGALPMLKNYVKQKQTQLLDLNLSLKESITHSLTV